MSAPTVLDGAVVLGLLAGIRAWATASPLASALCLLADLSLVAVDLLALAVLLGRNWGRA